MRKILIVEDDAQVRELVSATLESSGWSASAVGDAETALCKIRSEPFDLILTDIWLPKMNGLELLSQLQVDSAPPRAVVMTGDDTPAMTLEAIRAKAWHYITKPFEMPVLLAMIKEALAAPSNMPSIEVLCAQPHWVELIVPCHLETAERIQDLLLKLKGDLPEEIRTRVGTAFRELLLNAIEWGGRFDPNRKVRLAYIRGKRLLLYWIADPGPGFRPQDLPHAALNNPARDPTLQQKAREEAGIRPGGFGLLMARAMADELIFNEAHNEVLLIKYLDEETGKL